MAYTNCGFFGEKQLSLIDGAGRSKIVFLGGSFKMDTYTQKSFLNGAVVDSTGASITSYFGTMFGIVIFPDDYGNQYTISSTGASVYMTPGGFNSPAFNLTTGAVVAATTNFMAFGFGR
jgi:hypothetical protein